MVKTSPGLGDGSSVGQHAHCTLHLGQVTSGNDSGRLVVDANLEPSGAPVHELDCALGLDGCDSCIDILRDYVSTIQHAASHVFAMARVAFDHLVGWLEAGVGDLSHAQLLVIGFFCRDDRGVRDEREVDTRVRHQVGLELGQIHVQGSIEAKGGSDGRDNLADEAVEVGVGGSLDVEVPAADVVDGLVVHHECTVGVL